jgi:hypothetical protein
VKFDEQERAALMRAGFDVADDNKAAYFEALVVIGAHDDETCWLTISLPNDRRIVCAIPRDQVNAAIMGDCGRRTFL